MCVCASLEFKIGLEGPLGGGTADVLGLFLHLHSGTGLVLVTGRRV